MGMKIRDILDILAQHGLIIRIVGKPNLDLPVDDVEIKSDKVKENSLFICRKGYKFDSHKLFKEVVKRGAVLILTEREVDSQGYPYVIVKDSRKAEAVLASYIYSFPHEKLIVIGITGTNGKTTAVQLIHHFLTSVGRRGSYNSTIGNSIMGRFHPTINTTPSAIDITRMLDLTVKNGGDFAVIEVSSHALSLKRVEGIRFDHALITNITHDHLDHHGKFENYVRTKYHIFDLLKENGRAIMSYDVFKMFGPPSVELNEPLLIYGMEGNEHCDIHIENLKMDKKGSSFEVIFEGKNFGRFSTKLIGRFNVLNVLAALSVMVSMGYKPSKFKIPLKEFRGVEGRFELIEDRELGIDVVIDFAHTPDALQKAIETARMLTKGRIITVFGAGGDGDRLKRPLMGKIASRLSDVVIITTDNPKGEDPMEIIKEIEKGVDKTKPYLVIEDRRKAIEVALAISNRKDLILIAGKGHERTIMFNDHEVPFYDKDVVLEIMRRMKEMKREGEVVGYFKMR